MPYPATSSTLILGRPMPASDRAADTGLGQHLRRCRYCQCVLSRYNEEPHCGSCSRRTLHQSDSAPVVPTDVWTRTDVQEALFSRDFGGLCQLIRIYSDLRQSDIAELTGLSQAFLSMLESGTRRLTNIDKIVELLGGLNTPAELTGPMLRMPSRMDTPDEGYPPATSASPRVTGEN